MISSGKKSTGKKLTARNGNEQAEKDLDDEETFTNGESLLSLPVMSRC